MARKQEFSQEQIAAFTSFAACERPAITSSRVEKLVTDLIGRVADKWTMLVLETLVEKGELRFTRLAEAIPGVSQKMLTQNAARHGTRWAADSDRPSGDPAQSRIQTDGTWIQS